jgi:hypothetical protein
MAADLRLDNNPALIGKAGESLVAAELLQRGVHVAVPVYDGGVDLIAYREREFRKVVPIQVKARSETLFHFEKSWFDRAPGMTLVQVWFVWTEPKFFIFSSVKDVEDALGPVHAASASWTKKGGYNVTHPIKDQVERMQSHQDRWDRIISQLLPTFESHP